MLVPSFLHGSHGRLSRQTHLIAPHDYDPFTGSWSSHVISMQVVSLNNILHILCPLTSGFYCDVRSQVLTPVIFLLDSLIIKIITVFSLNVQTDFQSSRIGTWLAFLRVFFIPPYNLFSAFTLEEVIDTIDFILPSCYLFPFYSLPLFCSSVSLILFCFVLCFSILFHFLY